MYDAPLFLFITTQIGSFSLSRDFLTISLIHVFPAPKNSSCKLIKQSNQPIHTLFSHFRTLICPNTASGSMHLCPLCFSPSSEQSSSLAFCLYFLSLWFSSIVRFPFALKQRHLRGQPSHLTALYVAFSLTYPDAVFTCLVPILCILCPMGQIQKSCSSL